MSQAPQNLLQGQAGVYRVASELCLRGFNPYFPAVDVGADMVIDGGIRIQVKCAHRRASRVYPSGAYWFKLGRTTIRQRRQVWEARNLSGICDFVVFWGIEDDRFWIVPALECDDHQCLVLGPDPMFKSLDESEIQALRKQGLFYEEIAKQVGCSAHTVSRRIAAERGNPKKDLALRVRRLENHWDLIHSFFETLKGEKDSSEIEQEKI